MSFGVPLSPRSRPSRFQACAVRVVLGWRTGLAMPGRSAAGKIRRNVGRDRPSLIAIELAFLGDPLMRLAGALDAILPIIAFGGKHLRDLVDVARAAAAMGPGHIKDGLADLELV